MDEDKQLELWERCRGFVDEQRISCREVVYQSDRVIENAYEFIRDICEIVGYLADPNDEEDFDDE